MNGYHHNLSKGLSWILRHGAVKNGLNISSDGYIEIEEIKSLPQFKKYDLSDFQFVTKKNDKKRFTMKEEDNKWYIRANQGHSQEVGNHIKQEELLTKINAPLDVIIHGTTYQAYKLIQKDGLNRMERTHIHFAITEDIIKGNQQQSGIRSNCQVLIYLDMKKAMEDGLEFYLSDNNVVLSPGDNDGIISSKYILKTIDRINGKPL